jgi:hypothetical protein
MKSTIVYCNNVSTVYLFTNPIQHQRTKHVEIGLHFVREHVAIGRVNKFIVFFLKFAEMRQNRSGPNFKIGEFWNSNLKFLKK